MAVLWLSRTGFTPALPGWSNLFLPKFVTDTTGAFDSRFRSDVLIVVMMFGVLILFFIPSFKSDDLTMHNPCWDDDMILIVDGDIWKQISWYVQFLNSIDHFSLLPGILCCFWLVDLDWQLALWTLASRISFETNWKFYLL